jgi:hypothetical protein
MCIKQTNVRATRSSSTPILSSDSTRPGRGALASTWHGFETNREDCTSNQILQARLGVVSDRAYFSASERFVDKA